MIDDFVAKVFTSLFAEDSPLTWKQELLLLLVTYWIFTEPKMAVRCVLLSALIWVSLSCSSHAGVPENAGIEPAPISQPLRRICKAKEDCPENQFCEGRSHNKRCRPCVDCAGFQRLPKKSYDGQSCATHHTECGECTIGYEDMGGVCLPKTTPTQIPPTLSDFGRHVENEKNGDFMEANSTNLVLVVAICVLVGFPFVIAVIWKCYNAKKNNPYRTEEEAGLTSYNGPYDPPTAPPPEEYNTQPPCINTFPQNAFHHGSSSIFRPKVTEYKSRALPFDAGNGAGEWITTDDSGDLPDAVDGTAASTPTVPQNATPGNVTATTNHVTNSSNGRNDNNRLTSDDRRPPPNVTGNMQSSGPVSNLREGENRALLNEASTAGPSHSRNWQTPRQHDPVMAEVQFFAQVAIFSRPNFTSTPEGSQPPQSRLAISAPASPRRIDDTHIMDITELDGSFRSNASLDSGTGTNDQDQSVPSRSVSGGFSELDETGFYEDIGSPSTPGQAAQVPDQQMEYDD